MAVEANPAYLQNQTYSAELVRRASTGYALLRGATIGSAAGGVVNLAAGDLQLTAPASGLSVNIAAGECLVNGGSTAVQGPYYLRNTATFNAALAAANPSNPRVDLVCATINDAAYSGSLNNGVLQVITGTPTSGATLGNLTGAPALPTSSLLLGYVLTPAGATNTITADIRNSGVQLSGSLALGSAALGANTWTGAQTAPSFIASGSTGATAASNYGGATTSGAPASGTWTNGTYVIDQSGSIWVCTTAGTPGTWTQAGGVTTTDTVTLTNKRITKRVLALSANSATPAINTDNYDVVHITAQTAAITSFSSGLTGTPVDGDTLRISITGTAAVALTWGSSFESSTVTLPTTTVTTARLDVGFFWNTESSQWRCMASA